MGRGQDASDLGFLAEDTFRQLLRVWFGDRARTARPDPDVLRVDLRTVVRSRWVFGPDLAMNFQLKARTIPARPSRRTGQPVFRLSLTESDRAALRDLHEESDPTFFVLAVPVGPLEEILCAALKERFEFYAVEVRTYIAEARAAEVRAHGVAKAIRDLRSIEFRLTNRWNAGVMALTWASHWVAALARGGGSDPVVQRGLGEILVSAARTIDDDAALREFDAHTLSSDYQRVARDLSPAWIAPTNYLVGTLIALSDLRKRIRATGPIALSAYAPESLSEEIAIWLFARWFYRYLGDGVAASGGFGGCYSRMLPIPSGDPCSLPLHLRCLVFYVREFHERLSARCALVDLARDSEQADRIVIDPLGAVPMVFYEGSQGFHYDVVAQPAARGAERDFLSEAVQRAVVDEVAAPPDYAQLLRIDPSELQLGGLPVHLFASEDSLRRNPRELFAAARIV